jgi:hypothetical protein
MEEVLPRLEECSYLNRYDFGADVQRVFDNAVKFNGPQSVLGVSATHMRTTFDSIFVACVNNDRSFCSRARCEWTSMTRCAACTATLHTVLHTVLHKLGV